MIVNKKGKKIKAKLTAQPASWNTFHYIVETESDVPSDKFLYFSEAAPGKPPVDTPLGTIGEVEFDGTIWHWKTIDLDSNE